MALRPGLMAVLAAVILGILLSGCSDGLPPEFPAPDFTFKDILTGRDITLSAYKGRPVILYFFASW